MPPVMPLIVPSDSCRARVGEPAPRRSFRTTKVNGAEIHYVSGGAGEPVFLLHGVPKTMSNWRHVVPLLTLHYTAIAVDDRGAAASASRRGSVASKAEADVSRADDGRSHTENEGGGRAR